MIRNRRVLLQSREGFYLRKNKKDTRKIKINLTPILTLTFLTTGGHLSVQLVKRKTYC